MSGLKRFTRWWPIYWELLNPQNISKMSGLRIKLKEWYGGWVVLRRPFNTEWSRDLQKKFVIHSIQISLSNCVIDLLKYTPMFFPAKCDSPRQIKSNWNEVFCRDRVQNLFSWKRGKVSAKTNANTWVCSCEKKVSFFKPQIVADRKTRVSALELF